MFVYKDGLTFCIRIEKSCHVFFFILKRVIKYSS